MVSVYIWWRWRTGKNYAILHNNNYFDPETPTTYHADPTPDKIARATFFGSTSNVGTWTRFTAPFVYSSSGSPSFIMINITCSANQTTTITGSKMWVDDISFVYNTISSINEHDLVKNAKVYYFDKNVYVSSKISQPLTIELFDITGRTVLTHTTEDASATIDVSVLKAGIYLYKLNGHGQSKFGKFLVE